MPSQFIPLYNGPLSLWHDATTTPHNALNATEPFQQQSFPVELTSYADDAARTSLESNAHTFATQQNYNDSTLAQQLSVCNLCPNESKKEMLLLFMGKNAQTEMRSVFQKTVFLSVYDFWNVFKITTRATRIHPQCGHLLNTPKTRNAPAFHRALLSPSPH